MQSNRPRLAIGAVPLHALISPIPVVCFTGALLTDWTYSRSAAIQWSNFSAWLLAFGLLFGGIATVLAVIEYLLTPAPRPSAGWLHIAGSVAVLILALINSFVHARDGWTSVVPTGLALSVVTVLLMIVTAVIGHTMAPRPVASARS